MDGGKPIRESRDVDIPLAAAHFFHYAGWADKLRHGVGGRDARPYGVVGQIVPWNFPLLMAAWKLAPAIACGNTAVLKPAETTPLTALLLADICQEAELPAGVVNSAEQLERIEALVAAGEDEGAVRRSISCELPERGFWFAPTLFTDVAPAYRVAVEEIFGPVVSVLTFRTQAEAIEKANNSRYGLAAGIWTDKGSKAFEVASALQAGVVWQNTYNHFDPTAAFGGYKESGFGREGGPAGLPP